MGVQEHEDRYGHHAGSASGSVEIQRGGGLGATTQPQMRGHRRSQLEFGLGRVEGRLGATQAGTEDGHAQAGMDHCQEESGVGSRSRACRMARQN